MSISAERIAYWDQLHADIQNEKQLIKNKISEIELYCKNNLPVSRGLVYTRLDEEIKKNQFLIWIEQGIHITHRYIKFAETGIEPIEGLKYLALDH